MESNVSATSPAVGLPKIVNKTTMATVARKAQPPQQLQQQKQPPYLPTSKQKETKSNQPPKKSTVDTRLLVRVSQGHPALYMSPFAIMLSLNQFLQEKLVREIQVTKTGFATCPTSLSAQVILTSRMADIETFLSTKGPCKVEKTTNHTSYLITNIPRSHAGYNGSAIEMIEITASSITEAL